MGVTPQTHATLVRTDIALQQCTIQMSVLYFLLEKLVEGRLARGNSNSVSPILFIRELWHDGHGEGVRLIGICASSGIRAKKVGIAKGGAARA
eukprot:CAMPEP_0115880850 /NCGR_PEP_ID=MMETSP0287-20121206/28102_1 /TAXON_ID=412157 /ORGANISM="Chrysochromulina rotalis, Strain UIO044" /LENGTH=92 /DNA_ID=CAMNT_0003336711 /DNA_START=154 /DNA_END=429 /DNA_ORIENTATION=+